MATPQKATKRQHPEERHGSGDGESSRAPKKLYALDLNKIPFNEMLPVDFNELSEREQFLARRQLFYRGLEYYREAVDENRKPFKRPDLCSMRYMITTNSALKYEELGVVPGTRVGDIYDYVSEMYVLGLHQHTQKGIGSIIYKGANAKVASCVLVSGGYRDNIDNGDTIIYSGEGGTVTIEKVQFRDQEIEGGNEALINSSIYKKAVRVVRGYPRKSAGKKIYSYDGLYQVISYTLEENSSGYKVFKFRLDRELGQPPLNIEEMKTKALNS